MTTLLYALRARGKKRGIASLCIGGAKRLRSPSNSYERIESR